MRVEFIKPVQLTIKNKDKPTNEDKETDLNPASLEVTSKRPPAEPSLTACVFIAPVRVRLATGARGVRVGWGDWMDIVPRGVQSLRR